jgi:hypothetical protein
VWVSWKRCGPFRRRLGAVASRSTSPKTSATAPAGNVAFQLRVVDSYGASDTSSIFFTVQNPK